MELSVEQIQDGIKKISLRGRMDIAGTEAVDLRLAVETAAEKGFVVIDLTELDFLASVGIGVLIRSVTALRKRGGEAVLRGQGVWRFGKRLPVSILLLA